MAVLNVHERLLQAAPTAAGALLDSLATETDRLWPGTAWPPLRLTDGLAPGSRGGHGPVRYTVCAYAPGQWVRFTFSGPRGFHGFHEYSVHPVDAEHAVLRHTLAMRTRGRARLTWPLAYRHLHDAVLEDSLDHAERAVTGQIARPARWSRYVRLLRGLARRRQ